LALKRLFLLTSITVALAADKDKPRLEINPAGSYPHHMTSQGLTIAAIPYETEEQAKTAFGKVNPNAHGILPILVVVENNSPNTIRLERMKLEYTAQGSVKIENTPAAEVRFLRGQRDGPDVDRSILGRQPTHLAGMLTRDEVWDRYSEATGLDTSHRRFYEVFGLFRLGVIAQQIYYRYHHGQTTNEESARFLPVVQYLDERCNRLLDEAAP